MTATNAQKAPGKQGCFKATLGRRVIQFESISFHGDTNLARLGVGKTS